MENITASEALFGFAAWLSAQDPPIMLGATIEATHLVHLVSRWMETNELDPPREGIYPNNIRHPTSTLRRYNECI